MTSRPRTWVPLVAAAALLAGCGGSSPSASPSASSATPTPTAGSTSPQPATSTTTLPRLPVYWLGGTPTGPRLFREFASPPPTASGPPAAAAIRLLLADRAADPAYRSGWPSGTTLVAAAAAGSALTVTLDLAGAAAEPRGSLAVQQLVYTATAAQPGISSVSLRQQAASGTVAYPRLVRAPQLDVLAPIWVIEPQWGTTVTGPALTVSGSAAVPEAQLSWRVLQGGRVVASGQVTASIGAPSRGTWQVTTQPLDPGTYVVEAYDRSLEDGSVYAIDRTKVTVTG